MYWLINTLKLLKTGYIRVVWRRETIDIKYVQKVIKLSVNITTNSELVALEDTRGGHTT